VLLLLLLLLSLILLLLTNLVGIEGAGLVIEVAFLILLVLLSVVVARMLIILFKLRTATWGLIFGQSASFGSLSIPVDTAWVGLTVGTAARALFTLGVRTVRCLDTLGGDVPLFGGVMLRLVDNISVKASIAAFHLLPVLRNGFAAAGFFNASVSSSRAEDALSAGAVICMLYFSGKKTTVSDTLVPLVLGI
jgi:hypothetical protein